MALFRLRGRAQPRVVDALLEAATTAPLGVRSYLNLAHATKLWVYQVADVRPGAGMTLRDVVSGKEIRVTERSASQELHRWAHIATRIMPAGTPGDPVLDGGILPIPAMRAESLVDWLRDAGEGADEATDFDDLVPDIHRAWIAPMTVPKLVDYDGEPVVLTRVYFDVEDAAAVVTSLDGGKDFKRVENEGDPPRWSWTGTGKDKKEPVV